MHWGSVFVMTKPAVMSAAARIVVAPSLLLLLIMDSISVYAQTGDKIQSLISKASQECRAAKTKRRSDLSAAQQHFSRYRELINEAVTLQPDLLDSPSGNTRRILDFCNAVKKDLDRAEALPLFEQGIRECGEARVLLSSDSFDEARDKYQAYLDYKNNALAISDTVFEVYENSYQVRLCDRLATDISSAEAEYQRQLRIQAAANKENEYQEVIQQLSQANRQCDGARNLANATANYSQQTLSQMEELISDAIVKRDAALATRDRLTAQGAELDNDSRDKIKTLLADFQRCQASVVSRAERLETILVAREAAEPDQKPSESVNRPLRQIVGAPAQYPKPALERRINGYVKVVFSVTEEGNVTDVEVVEAKPKGFFENSAIEAVKQYKFQPRIENGKPVVTTGVQQRISFKLQ